MSSGDSLREQLASIPASPWGGEVFRACWQGRDPLQGSRGGGRWSRRNGFEVIYTCLEFAGAIAEIDAWLSEITPRPDRPVLVHKLVVQTRTTLRLSDMERLEALGVDGSRYRERHYERTQAIGEAADALGCDSILVPSARWAALNLVLLPENADQEFSMKSGEATVVDWDRWYARRQT